MDAKRVIAEDLMHSQEQYLCQNERHLTPKCKPRNKGCLESPLKSENQLFR